MDKIVELKAVKNALKLVINELGWCQIYLLSDKITQLGADTFKIVRDRIKDYLRCTDTSEKQVYEHAGLKIIWILSLSEKHASIYGTLPSRDQDRKIFCVENDGNFLPELKISEQHVERWIMALDD